MSNQQNPSPNELIAKSIMLLQFNNLMATIIVQSNLAIANRCSMSLL